MKPPRIQVRHEPDEYDKFIDWSERLVVGLIVGVLAIGALVAMWLQAKSI